MPEEDRIGRTNAFRPKIFLADLEFAKKEELERRRKLRLKQVRQQARDIAAIIRTQTGDARKRAKEWSIHVQCQAADKSLENGQKLLQERLQGSLHSVGTAHSSATVLSEVDQLLQHRAELQDTLARVRAELAAEKTKKPCPEIVQCPREGKSISKISFSKPHLTASIKRILTPISKTDSRSKTVPPTSSDFICENSTTSCHTEYKGPAVLENTIYSPPKLTEGRVSALGRSDGRKSCPPTKEYVQMSDSCDSDDSGQTWPITSVKKKKPNRVRMYDHSAKKCSVYVQQRGVICLGDPRPEDMKNLIQEEEHLLSRKSEEGRKSKRLELQRGLKALSEESARISFDNTIQGLCQSSKENRLRRALAYPSVPSAGAPLASGSGNDDPQPLPSRVVPARAGQGDCNEPVPTNHLPPVTVPDDPLSTIMTSLNERREHILKDRSQLYESSDAETVESSHDEESQLPLWLREEFEAQNNREAARERVTTPNTVMSTFNDNNKFDSGEVSDCNQEPTSSSITATVEDNCQPSCSQAGQSTDSESPKCPRKGDEFLIEPQTRPPISDESSSSGIDVHIKIAKTSSPSKRSTLETPQKSGDSSTSYYSPPNKLSAAQVSVLNDILSKVSVKNRNPVLNHYIMRVLNMSHQSVSDLDVSTSSDLTIQSDLFPPSEQSTPKKAETTGNLSTVVSVGSTLRAPSSSEQSPDYAAQIAQLLSNMIDLQTIRLSRSTTESDGRSSYKSVPGSVKSGVSRPALNYVEDTGIFDSSNRPCQPHFSGDNFGVTIPYHLLPKPFLITGSELSAEDQCDLMRRLMDVPDGYSTKPEQNLVAGGVTSGILQMGTERLSDVESVLSSIHGTPSKRTQSRPSSPTESLPASEIASSDFISSTEMLNNDLIGSSATSSNFEDVFRSLGIGWALSTLRRTRNSKNLRADDSSSNTGDSVPTVTSCDNSGNGSTYQHSTPVKTSTMARKSPDINAIPSLTPPNISLHCPNLFA